MKEIFLTQNKVTLVDDENYEFLSQWKWYAVKHGKTYYARRNLPKKNGKRGFVTIHQLLFGNGRDHIDRNGLNNQKENIRQATQHQNICNRSLYSTNKSGFRGVSWKEENKKWQSSIRYNGATKYLGYFDSVVKAACAYDDKAIELFGAFAQPNFGFR